MSGTPPVFSIDSVAKSFGSRQVLSTASVWVHPGRTTVLIGRNGCGKSTLLRVGVGLTAASRGVIMLDGERWKRPAFHALARHGVFFWPDQALLPRDEPVSRLFDWLVQLWPTARVQEAVDYCRLDPLWGATTRQLSGGERRRVELGLVLARNPRVLLADEPFLGVMPSDQPFLIDAFQRLGEAGTGLLITGHEVDTLLDLADDVIWMTAGTTHHLGSPSEARKHDQFGREYLGRAAS